MDQEVTAATLTKEHPPIAAIVGKDVCVLANAFKNDTLQTPGAIGWRALVTKKFGSQLKDNIQVDMALT